MTTVSTALLLVGPSGVGPFQSRDWRVNPSTSCQLVEGGNNGPYFLYTLGEKEAVFHLDSLDPEILSRGLVLMTAILTNDEQSLGILHATENLIETDRGERVAPFWEIADGVLLTISRRLSLLCRIGVVRLDGNSLFTSEVLDKLRILDFDVTEFDESESFFGRTPQSNQTTEF